MRKNIERNFPIVLNCTNRLTKNKKMTTSNMSARIRSSSSNIIGNKLPIRTQNARHVTFIIYGRIFIHCTGLQ